MCLPLVRIEQGGREESNPSVCPWFSGITSSQQPTDLESSPRFFGWHTFRRSFATWVVGNTKDVKAAQELLRHSTSKLTLDVYAQALSENKIAASKAIAGSLLLPQLSICTRVQEGQCPEEPVKLNQVNESPSSSPA